MNKFSFLKNSVLIFWLCLIGLHMGCGPQSRVSDRLSRELVRTDREAGKLTWWEEMWVLLCFSHSPLTVLDWVTTVLDWVTYLPLASFALLKMKRQQQMICKALSSFKISWFHDSTHWNLGLSPSLGLTLGHHCPPRPGESVCKPHSLPSPFHLNNFAYPGNQKKICSSYL